MVKGVESRRVKNENRELRVRFKEKDAGLLTESHSPFSLLPHLKERPFPILLLILRKQYCFPEGEFDP